MPKRKAEKEGYGKSFKYNWKKYLLWYLIIGILIYLAIYFLYLRGSPPAY